MDRIYLDSNIFRAIKPNRNQYKHELHRSIELLKDKFIFCFSDAHLDDLYQSNKEYWNEDLELMGQYVNDNYYHYDPIKKQFKFLLASPTEVFYQKDYKAYADSINMPFDLDNLFSGLEGEHGKILSGIMKSFFQLPLSLISGNTIDVNGMDAKNREMLDKFIPGFSPHMQLGSFMTSMQPYISSLLKDSKEVKQLRKHIADYINKDEYSFEKWGNEFNEKLKETPLGKTFFETIDMMLLDKQKNDFYLQFKYSYSLLEIFNITQENVGKKSKNNNLLSLDTDASHTYIASHCDYLVSDDKGLLIKSKILYDWFGLHTRVLSAEDYRYHICHGEQQ